MGCAAVPFDVGEGLQNGGVHRPGDFAGYGPAGQRPGLDDDAGPLGPVGQVALQGPGEVLTREVTRIGQFEHRNFPPRRLLQSKTVWG